MFDNPQKQLSQLLHLTAGALDMPEELYREAVSKYEEVGRWLGAADSALYGSSPEIYPQGSMRLGTINRPLTDKDEYDIDLVCVLQLKRQSIAQKDLKKRVGDRLKQNLEYRYIIEEGRRCWTLNFETHFHMDVLPGIPDEDRHSESILITDKELIRWQCSDPKGYANWFWSRMKVAFEQEKQAMAEAMKANIEDVPDWKVKTPLQRAVQLLKRHRDLHFQNDQNNKPVSIIITTLAAWAYSGQTDLLEALVHIVRTMPDYIKMHSGECWVTNPVNDEENFADKWQQYPQRQDKFFAWLKKVEADVMTALEKRGVHEVIAALETGFGNSAMMKVAKSLGDDFHQKRQAGKLFMAAGTGALGSAGPTSVRNHTFYGE